MIVIDGTDEVVICDNCGEECSNYQELAGQHFCNECLDEFAQIELVDMQKTFDNLA